MNPWIVLGAWLAFATAVAFAVGRIERNLNHEPDWIPVAPVDDGHPVVQDCRFCHGCGYNDSLLLTIASGDRTCRDCEGTGVRVVWLVDCPVCKGHGTVYIGHDPATGIPMDDTCHLCGGEGLVDAERVA